jgi:hypothetical protein
MFLLKEKLKYNKGELRKLAWLVISCSDLVWKACIVCRVTPWSSCSSDAEVYVGAVRLGWSFELLKSCIFVNALLNCLSCWSSIPINDLDHGFSAACGGQSSVDGSEQFGSGFSQIPSLRQIHISVVKSSPTCIYNHTANTLPVCKRQDL